MQPKSLFIRYIVHTTYFCKHYMKHFYIFPLAILLYSGCAKKATVPSYLHVAPFVLTTDNATQGSNSANITDIWLYANGQLQGVYELPCTVPIIPTGDVKIAFRPGIKKNGTANERTYYPFYNYVDTTLTMEANQTTSYTPHVKYIPNLVFAWLENFEISNFTLKKTSFHTAADSLQICTDTNTTYKGGQSGRIVLTKKNEVFEYASKTPFTLPGSGRDIYLEVNYKTDLPLIVSFYDNSIIGVNKYSSVVTINPTAQWKKIYIYLTEEVSNKINSQGATTFSLYFNAINDADKLSEIMLDNIKLIYR